MQNTDENETKSDKKSHGMKNKTCKKTESVNLGVAKKQKPLTALVQSMNMSWCKLEEQPFVPSSLERQHLQMKNFRNDNYYDTKSYTPQMLFAWVLNKCFLEFAFNVAGYCWCCFFFCSVWVVWPFSTLCFGHKFYITWFSAFVCTTKLWAYECAHLVVWFMFHMRFTVAFATSIYTNCNVIVFSPCAQQTASTIV